MEHEDTLRTTFTVLRRGETPPPDDNSAARVISRGRAVRARRRNAAVIGSALAAAGVATLAFALLPKGPAVPVEPAAPSNSTTHMTTSDVPLTTPQTTTTRTTNRETAATTTTGTR
ncbi:hypothetical protein SAMN05216553_101380 [Lentzea fradiae]|uniref:Uncharacterized protein n=1 Tax=Lentzea fradiae TaxID=200378 RepID=A0A1G7KPA0_9PSEU|nr:hypothetical protein [Lentzea fradiae]SDF38599.1 hypothetical protein SAMN05216553_101380 [Lentzea fradiae]